MTTYEPVSEPLSAPESPQEPASRTNGADVPLLPPNIEQAARERTQKAADIATIDDRIEALYAEADSLQLRSEALTSELDAIDKVIEAADPELSLGLRAGETVEEVLQFRLTGYDEEEM